MSDNGHTDADTLTLEPLAFAERGRASLFRPLGDTGVARWGGVIADEPAGRLRGQRWLRVVRDMLDTPVIAGMLFATEMLIRRAEWEMEPAKDGGTEAKEIAEFVESCRLDMRTPWEDTLAQILSFLPYGYSLQEIVLKRRLGADGATPSESDDGRIGWDEWSPRAQDTLMRWVFDDVGHVIAFEQQAPSLPGPVTIPLSRCLHFRAGGYRGSPEGRSVLRAAYVDWDAINKLQLIEAIGIERDLAGLPMALLPARYLSQNRSAEEAAVFNAVKAIVTGVRNNDQAGVIFPLDYDEHGHETFKFSLLSAGGQRQFDTGSVINRRATHMTMALLADFLMVGHGKTGSFALSADKTRLFTTAISAWLDVIANTINDQAIRPLLAINGIDPRLAPALRPGALDEVDLKATGDYFKAMMPLLGTLNEEDHLNLATHLWNVADWPAPVTTLAEVEELAEEEEQEQEHPEEEPHSEDEQIESEREQEGDAAQEPDQRGAA